jgi:hypothetical protein
MFHVMLENTVPIDMFTWFSLLNALLHFKMLNARLHAVHRLAMLVTGETDN